MSEQKIVAVWELFSRNLHPILVRSENEKIYLINSERRIRCQAKLQVIIK